jgi:hypothetical protein
MGVLHLATRPFFMCRKRGRYRGDRNKRTVTAQQIAVNFAVSLAGFETNLTALGYCTKGYPVFLLFCQFQSRVIFSIIIRHPYAKNSKEEQKHERINQAPAKHSA